MKNRWTILGLIIFGLLGQGCGLGYAKGPYLYVLSNQNIIEIDTSTNKLTYEVPAGLTDSHGNILYPQNVAVTPDGKFVYLIYGTDLIAVLNSATHVLTKIGDLYNGSYSFYLNGVISFPDGKYVYVDGYPRTTGPCSGSIWAISIQTNAISQPDAIGQGCLIGGMAVTQDEKTLYLTNRFNGPPPGFVSVVNVMNGMSTSISNIVDSGGIAITPNGKFVYVAGYSNPGLNLSGGLYVIDTTKNAVSQIINIQNGQWIVISPDGTKAYETTGTSVVEINLGNNQVGQTVKINGAGHLTLTPDGQTLYVLGTNGIAVLNTTNNKIVTTIPLTAVDLAIQN
jgi:DNA-binding beta-propeller fold protein YncE